MGNQRSLYLNQNWDIGLNSSGNITTTSGLYCDAQNVANAVRLFTKDAFLAQDKGVPHFGLELGKRPALSAVRATYRKTAKAVPNIQDANVESIGMDKSLRRLTGRILATTMTGEQVAVEI